MLKKVLMACSTALLLLILLFGRDVASYITTSADWVGDSVRERIPLEFELERAKRMISELTPEVRANMQAIAREEIEIDRLMEKIDALAKQQNAQKNTLTFLQRELALGKQDVTIGTTIYTSAEVTDLAETRFERYKTQDTTLQSLRRTLVARRQSLDAAGKQLAAVVAARQQLKAEVASLEARQKMNEVARASNDSQFDDSQLARTRELIRSIETRVKVEERILETEQHIAMDDALARQNDGETTDIAARIAGYFQSDTGQRSTALAELQLEELSTPY